jgi:hypothetical protein
MLDILFPKSRLPTTESSTVNVFTPEKDDVPITPEKDDAPTTPERISGAHDHSGAMRAIFAMRAMRCG